MVDKVRWIGSEPDKCELCGVNLVQEFNDAMIPHVGAWGMICTPCFGDCGCGLGPGRGQRYKRIEGDWLKVAG